MIDANGAGIVITAIKGIPIMTQKSDMQLLREDVEKIKLKLGIV